MTVKVMLGSLFIGGDAPVSVQSMYDVPLSSLEKNFARRMSALKALGCDVMRISYPDIADHCALEKAVELCPMPVVADIHFDYRNALDAVKCGVAGIRINPGNIGDRWKTEEIVRACGDRNIAVRIGLNSGSLPHGGNKSDVAALMVDTALEYVSWCENLGFENLVVSLKSSNPEVTYNSYVKFSSLSKYPLHLGVTEAGGPVISSVRTTWILGRLLERKIGSTLRYSITGSIEDEVVAGVELLRTLGLRKTGVRIVSCPMCGRRSFDTQGFLADVQSDLLQCGKNITVAIMGCQVNGPGEAADADIAVCGIGNSVFLYRKGEIYCKVNVAEAKEKLFELIEGTQWAD